VIVYQFFNSSHFQKKIPPEEGSKKEGERTPIFFLALIGNTLFSLAAEPLRVELLGSLTTL